MPRRRAGAPHWRGGPRTLNTAGKSQRNTNGKRQRNPTTGKLRRNTSTNTVCCCNEGDDFEDCYLLGLRCLTVVTSGAAICGNTSNRNITGNVNGEFHIPVCGVLGVNCFLVRSFCDFARYAVGGIDADFNPTWSIASVLYMQMLVVKTGANSYQTQFACDMFGHRRGCCNQLVPTGTEKRFCWKSNHANVDDPTPPGPGGVKLCPCASDPTTIGVGYVLTFGTEFGSDQGPFVGGDITNWVGPPTSKSWSGSSTVCGTTATQSGNMFSQRPNFAIEFQYEGTTEDCPHALDDYTIDCDCDCGEDI